MAEINRPFFSICIAAYNADRYIDRCLSSILEQRFTSYEVIIIDDGSTKPLHVSPEIAKQLPSLKLVRQANSGPYIARQRAFDLAEGEYLLSFDSDDELSNEMALNNIYSATKSGADIVFFNAGLNVCPNQRMLNLDCFSGLGPISRKMVLEKLLTSSSLNSLWCKAISKNLYLASKPSAGKSHLVYAEDRLQSFELIRIAKSFAVLNEIIYIYYCNSGSTTNSHFIPDYLDQQLYVESKILTSAEYDNVTLKEWASYFLKSVLTNVKLLGFNSDLDYEERRYGYQIVVDNAVFSEAAKRIDLSSMSLVDRFLYCFLQHKEFVPLCIYSCLLSILSSIKHKIINHKP